MAIRPSHAMGNYAIELNGSIAGWVNSIEFPTIKVNQGNLKPGTAVGTAKPDGTSGHVSHTAFKASYSISETNNVVDWFMAVPRGVVITSTGAIILADQNFEAKRRCDWTVGHVTSVKFPKFSASQAKKPLLVDFEWEAETIEFSKASGKLAAPQVKKQKAFNSAFFRFEGLPGESAWITDVEVPAITARNAQERSGANYANYDIGDLKITFSSNALDSHLEYLQKLIRNGKLTADEYLDCELHMLDNSASKAIGSIQFYGCGLKEFSIPRLEANQEQLVKFTLSFSVERFDLKLA